MKALHNNYGLSELGSDSGDEDFHPDGTLARYARTSIIGDILE